LMWSSCKRDPGMTDRVGFVDVALPVTVESILNHPVEERLPQPNAAPHHASAMLQRVLLNNHAAAHELRTLRGTRTSQNSAVFLHPDLPDAVAGQDSAVLNLPILFNPNINGMEPVQHLVPNSGDMIAKHYRIDDHIGQGCFSSVFSATNVPHGKRVAIKIIRNDSKANFDTGVGEIRIHSLIQQHDPEGRRNIIRMVDRFYSREHLFIVTELLNNSLFAHYMHLETLGSHARAEFYNAATLGALSAQMLDALDFLQGIGIAHGDVKSANVCIVDSAARHFKLIDLGSAILRNDVHSSYVQSRWYRAPEVILGCEHDPKIDIWSLACLLAELILGFCPFQFPSCELVLGAQMAACGPFPAWMLTASPIAEMFFSPAGCVYEVDPPSQSAGVYLLRSASDSSLSSMLDARADSAIFGEPLDMFKLFLESLLTIDPNVRPTAADAIQHAWLAPYRLLLPHAA